jgi:spermidine/putrescine transport system substrate-binding protein
MSENYIDPSLITPQLIRGMTQRRIGRRGVLKGAAAGAAVAGLAGCSVKGKAVAKSSQAPNASAVAKFWADKKSTGHVNFANWPLYIDKKEQELKDFTSSTGVTVTYTEPIDDLASFFAKIQPQLAAKQSIGYDIMVITNGVEFAELVELGYYAPLDHSKMPNFTANALPKYKQEAYDPNNTYSIPWASGSTGIGYNPKYVTTKPTGMQDLMNPIYKGKVGMFSDTEEIGVFAMLAVGVKPETSTPSDWVKAAAWLKKQQDAGLVRKYYDQTYIAALGNGDIWISMAWSGDIYQNNISGGPHLEFVIPSEGGTLWTDNMTIPYTADSPVDALKLMDWFYQPAMATILTEAIAYISPVNGLQPLIQQDAAKATGSLKTQLTDLASSSLVFPTSADLAELHYYRSFKTPAEHDQYDKVFSPIVTS